MFLIMVSVITGGSMIEALSRESITIVLAGTVMLHTNRIHYVTVLIVQINAHRPSRRTAFCTDCC